LSDTIFKHYSHNFESLDLGQLLLSPRNFEIFKLKKYIE